MFNLVQIGRADAAVTGKPAAKLFAQSTTDLTVLGDQITTEDYGIAAVSYTHLDVYKRQCRRWGG